MQSRNLYSFIAAAVFLLLGLLAWASRSPFDGMPYWGWASAGLGVILLAAALWMSRQQLRGGIRQRSTLTGFQVAAMVIIVAGILTVIELFSVSHYRRWDLTPGKYFSLSAKTRNILEKVDREKRRIEFLSFTQKAEQQAVKEILEQYTHLTDQVTYRFVDLDANPQTAKKYDVDAYGTVVVVHHLGKDEEGAKAAAAAPPAKAKGAGAPGAAKENAEKKTFRSEKIFDLSENAIANAILKTIQTEQKRVYFLTGHGERLHAGTGRGVLGALATGMRDDNYRVEELLLLREKSVPKDANLLVIGAPQKDIEEAEAKYIEDFIKGGGRLLVFLEPESPRGRLTALLEKFGFEIPESFVIDPQAVRFALVGGNEVTPFASTYGIHEITKQMKGLATVFPTARRVAVKGDAERGLAAEELVKTGPGSFWVKRVGVHDNRLFYDPKEKKDGPVSLGAAVAVDVNAYLAAAKKKEKQGGGEAAKAPAPARGPDGKGKEARIVVYGDVDFASDAYIGAQGNANLAFNSVNWLGGAEELVSIRPKRRVGEPVFLVEGEGTFVRLLTVWLMPLFVILVGAAVYVRRRQLQ